MVEAKWGVYAPQAAERYNQTASLARLHARIGPLHLEKPKRPRRKLALLDGIIFCLIAVGAYHAVKAGEIAFWTGYEAQAMRGNK